MTEPTPSHLVVVLTVLVIPIVATLVMEVAEALVESLGWRIRLGRTGWDLCILGVGSTGAIFTLPGVVEEWGADVAVIAGLFVGASCGDLVRPVHYSSAEDEAGEREGLAGLCTNTPACT